MLIAPLAFAFAIVKYHVFDVEVVINRSVVYVLLTGFIVGIYLLLVGLAGHLLFNISPEANSFVAIVCTLLAAVLFHPAKQRIQQFVDKTFYRVKYSYRLITKDLIQSLVPAKSQAEALNLLMEKIQAALPVDRIAVALPAGSNFAVVAGHGLSEEEKQLLSFEQNDELLKSLEPQTLPLARKGRADPGAVRDLPPSAVLDRTAMEILVPMGQISERGGFLALGRKLSGSKYREEDVELLSALAAETFSALERIRFQEAAIQEKAEREKLEAVSELKSEFISLVSHELRNPLTTIRWSVQNLLDGIPESPTPKIREYLSGIHDNSSHLARMIEKLLDVTKIEAGKWETAPERLCLAEIIPMTVRDMAPLSETKKIPIQVEEMGGLHVHADRDAFKQILCNLLENAIKYSPEGKTVQVSAQSLPAEEASTTAMVAISVRDSGIGIPTEKQKSIFEKFERASREKRMREKGLGLGLFIVKKLVEAQGGAITVESEVVVGSKFTFTLPVAQGSQRIDEPNG
jgi:signal transduction histidine kinase